MNALTERLRAALQKAGAVRVIVLIGLAGMALILFSGLMPDRSEQAAAEPEQQTESTLPDADAYRSDLEKRLTALLSGMDGVGNVTVMLTVRGTAEQVYAEEVKTSSSDRSAQTESAFVITKSGGEESALVTETKYPEEIGAAVLCSGGSHAVVREQVTGAVSTVLGIPASQIYVGSCT